MLVHINIFSVFSLFFFFNSILCGLFQFIYSVLAFRNPNVGKNGKIESTESVHEKRNAKVAQTDGNFKVSASVSVSVAVVIFFFVICWSVTIETALTTTAAATVVTTEHDSMTHACTSILRSARPLNISFTESVLWPCSFIARLHVYLCLVCAHFFTKYRLKPQPAKESMSAPARALQSTCARTQTQK